MKILVILARVIVGLLFIFSGMVKANDPMGLSYKMQEFFEVWKLHGFDAWTLPGSVIMNAFEIIAGFAILIGWKPRIFTWLLLLMIVFFTFLTGYTYYTGKPTNCGCFGDCLPISSKTSFLKDVVLTILIAFLLWQWRKIQPLFKRGLSVVLMLLITAFSFGLQFYTLRYLPVVDCLPYKKGKDINIQIRMPANAIPDSTVIEFVYKKAGKEVRFTADQFPADFDSTYEYIDRKDRIVREGVNNKAPITGFVLTSVSGSDTTGFVLSQPQTILLFVEDMSTDVGKWRVPFQQIVAKAKSKNIPVFIVTGQRDALTKATRGAGFDEVPLLVCDHTAIRTAARVNPTLYLLNKGIVAGKWSYLQMSNIPL